MGSWSTHKTKNGTLSEEDDKTYKTMEDEITELTNEIHRMEDVKQSRLNLKKPVSKPIIENPMNGRLDNSEIKTGRAADSYKTAMLSAFVQTSVMYPMSCKKVLMLMVDIWFQKSMTRD